MENLITEELMEKTFLFCWKKLTDKDDAKDLAQEIVVDAMLVLRSGKKINNFYGLYWQIARNKVADFYRKKRPAKISLDDVENSLLGFDKSIGDFITKEELDTLATSINHLAAIYRDILVRFYIKNQSVKEIASELNIPTGTVTYRLSDARTKLREELETMETEKEDEEKSNPVNFNIDFRGQALPAYNAITSLLDKQILFLCRNEPKSEKELKKEINAAPVFIEDSIKKLINGNVLFEKTKGHYLTDFTIFPASVLRNAAEDAFKIAEKMHLSQRYFEILLGMKDEILAEDFYGNKLDWEYLLPYFIIRTDREFRRCCSAEYIRQKYNNNLPERYWRYFYLLGNYEDVPDFKPNPEIQKRNIIGPGYNYEHYISAKYGHYEIHNTINELKYDDNGKKCELNIDRLYWLNEKNSDLYREIIENEDRINHLTEKEQETVADFLSKGILIKNQDKNGRIYKGTIPIISFNLIDKWCKIWFEKFKSLAEEYMETLYQNQKETVLPYIRHDLLWASINFCLFPRATNMDNYLTNYALKEKLTHFDEGLNASCTAIVMLKE